MSRLVAIIAPLVACALALSSCGGSSSGDASTQASKPLRMVEAKEVLHKPYEIKAPPQGPAPEKLVVKEMHRGYGAPTAEGQKVMLMYLDADYRDKSGKLFYSAWNTLKFLTFKLGDGQASPSWEQAVKGMRLGGRREVIMPAKLSKGARVSPVIPPDAKTVVFIADLYGRS
jgi:peptidylprolyl isomerase